MSLPARGVLLVTKGSTSRSKNIGRSRASRASSVSPGCSGKRAPARWAAWAAAANASGVPASANFREVPPQRFLAQRQIAERVRVELDHSGLADALEQILSVGGRSDRRWRRRRLCHSLSVVSEPYVLSPFASLLRENLDALEMCRDV